MVVDGKVDVYWLECMVLDEEPVVVDCLWLLTPTVDEGLVVVAVSLYSPVLGITDFVVVERY